MKLDYCLIKQRYIYIYMYRNAQEYTIIYNNKLLLIKLKNENERIIYDISHTITIIITTTIIIGTVSTIIDIDIVGWFDLVG